LQRSDKSKNQKPLAALIRVAFLLEKAVTKEELTAALKDCTAKLGHAPNQAEFRTHTGISKNQVRKNFGTYKQMLFASEVERYGPGYTASLKSLFLDWARVARSLGKLPTIADYELHGRFSIRPLVRRFRTWSQAPAGLLEYAQKENLEEEWKDVLKIIVDHLEGAKGSTRTSVHTSRMSAWQGLLADVPIYGKPLHAPLSYAPTNESGVVFVFGTVAREMGFSIMRIQTEFPDCEAMREVERNKWHRVRIEFEYESRNFLMHGHKPDKCHLIVCWKHNWAESPLEVIELSSAMQNL